MKICFSGISFCYLIYQQTVRLEFTQKIWFCDGTKMAPSILHPKSNAPKQISCIAMETVLRGRVDASNASIFWESNAAQKNCSTIWTTRPRFRKCWPLEELEPGTPRLDSSFSTIELDLSTIVPLSTYDLINNRMLLPSNQSENERHSHNRTPLPFNQSKGTNAIARHHRLASQN